MSRTTRAKKLKGVLLLDDSPGLCSHLEQELKHYKLQVLCPKSSEDVQKFIVGFDIGVVIHGVHTSQSADELCREMHQLYPELPMLHIASEHCKEEHSYPRGFLSVTLPHLRSTKTIYQNIRKLWKLGKLVQREKQLNQAFKHHIELDQSLDTQEPELLVAKFMTFLGQRIQTENMLWLVEGDVDYYKEELWKIKPFSSKDNHVTYVNRSMAWNELKPQEITSVVTAIEKAGGEQWPSSYNPIYLKLQNAQYESCILIPIHEPGKLYGHFVFLNPRNVTPNGTLFYWLQRFTQAFRRSLHYAEARSLCYIDDVTEFYNQRYLGMALDTEISRARRGKTPFSVLFIDIDHFKKVNDNQGHLIGSKILKQLSKILKKNIRSVDYGFRYGGDEYVLLLVNTPQKTAELVAERIRSEVQAHVFQIDGIDLKITLSIGVATYPDHAATKEQIVDMADKAMYEGKNKSRNIVFVAS